MKGITVKKEEDFSEWYSQLVQKCELADLRYNVKGFVCFMPWSVMSMKKMYEIYERVLERNGHYPLMMPSLIPESNFMLEADHVEGFTPEVFWVTEAGKDHKFEERLALRPTSETALYKMYSLWIRSYKDLPFKRYQSCQVWRYEGKATRPFFRSREFHWIESHNVFATREEAEAQVKEDMEMTYEVLGDEFALPIMFFQRPEWDKFPGAIHTYAADALTSSGKVIQLPSTHLLGQNFSRPFDVKFSDEDGEEKYGWITCYGPAISRIYGGMIAILGDDKGLVLPFDLAPVQVVIVPIVFKDSRDEIMDTVRNLEKELPYRLRVDERDDISPGEKFNEWEMKGVPVRIEIGPKDLENDQATVVTRHDGKKEAVKLKDLKEHLQTIASRYTKEIKDKQNARFKDKVVTCKTLKEAKEAIAKGKIVACGFCTCEMDAQSCAEVIEKETSAEVRGKKVGSEDLKFDECIVCSKKATETVYLARSY